MSGSRTTKVIGLSSGTFLTQIVGMASGIVMTRVLSKTDLATYRQTLLAYNFAAPLLVLGLPSALFFFLPRRRGAERTVLLGNLLLLTIMGAVFTAFLLLGGAKVLALRFNNPRLEPTLQLMAFYPLAMLPVGALEACLVASNRIGTLAFYNVLSRLILTVVLIAVCLESARPESLVLSNVIVAGALLLPALVLMFQACPGEMHTPDAPLLWQMVKYSVPLGLATMLGTMTLQLSSVIVSSMCTPEQFAVYSTGAVEIPLVGIVTGSITTVILADMARLCHEGRRGEALQLFQTAALRSAAILLPAMVFFWIAAEPFIVALYSPKYHDSVLPFRLYLLALPVRTVTYGAALMALGKTRLVLIRSAIELMLNALLCIIMVRVLGYLGGVIALLLTLYTWSSAYNLHAISDGFSVRFRTVLPFAKLTQIAGIAIISGVPAWAVMMLVRAPEIQKLLLLAVVYWPLALYFLKKHGDLVVPARVGLLLCKVRALLPGSVPA